MRSMRKGMYVMLLVWMMGVVLGLLGISEVWAWSAPQQGSFAYDVYDIAINKIAKGPIGFVAGAGLMVGAIFSATRAAWVPAVLMAVGSGALFNVDTIVQSLGYII